LLRDVELVDQRQRGEVAQLDVETIRAVDGYQLDRSRTAQG
jgi:hypothetical protein